MSDGAILILGVCGVVGAACIATSSADPLWALFILYFVL